MLDNALHTDSHGLEAGSLVQDRFAPARDPEIANEVPRRPRGARTNLTKSAIALSCGGGREKRENAEALRCAGAKRS